MTTKRDKLISYSLLDRSGQVVLSGEAVCVKKAADRIKKFILAYGWKEPGSISFVPVRADEEDMAMDKKQRDPEDDFAPEVKDALNQIERIEKTIEEEVSDRAKTQATSFFEDVLEKARAVGLTIEKTNRVTDAQQKALDGWEAGVRKWVHKCATN